jgi:hypothetical protein
MVELQVSEIHDLIFEYLFGWHRSCDENELNPYFYIRTRSDDRFNKGFWFLGDDHHLNLSFWAGGDALNQTPNIYLNIDYVKGISIMLAGRDSEYKRVYFEYLANFLGGFKQESEVGLWSKHIGPFDANFLQIIKAFMCCNKFLKNRFSASINKT